VVEPDWSTVRVHIPQRYKYAHICLKVIQDVVPNTALGTGFRGALAKRYATYRRARRCAAVAACRALRERGERGFGEDGCRVNKRQS
jgi:hypothetical protein